MVLAGFCEENTAYFRRIWLNVVWKFTKSKKNDKKDCSIKCFVLRKDVFFAISQGLVFQNKKHWTRATLFAHRSMLSSQHSSSSSSPTSPIKRLISLSLSFPSPLATHSSKSHSSQTHVEGERDCADLHPDSHPDVFCPGVFAFSSSLVPCVCLWIFSLVFCARLTAVCAEIRVKTGFQSTPVITAHTLYAPGVRGEFRRAIRVFQPEFKSKKKVVLPLCTGPVIFRENRRKFDRFFCRFRRRISFSNSSLEQFRYKPTNSQPFWTWSEKSG